MKTTYVNNVDKIISHIEGDVILTYGLMMIVVLVIVNAILNNLWGK